jgi:hypothetical protein
MASIFRSRMPVSMVNLENSGIAGSTMVEGLICA